MIRWSATGNNGRQIVGLGVSDENVAALTAGRPIFVAGETVGLSGVDVLIYHGRTEYELTEAMATLIGPKTQVRPIKAEELPPDHRDWKPRPAREGGER